MPIPKAKIEEWTAMLARIFPLGGMVTGARERAASEAPALAAAASALLSEREEILALLREVEWVPDSEGFARWCPSCAGQEPTAKSPAREESFDPHRRPQRLHRIGHADHCRLAALR